ncbi:ankyrin repeat domain-containing protein [Candidatus Dependentiae bacterium]
MRKACLFKVIILSSLFFSLAKATKPLERYCLTSENVEFSEIERLQAIYRCSWKKILKWCCKNNKMRYEVINSILGHNPWKTIFVKSGEIFDKTISSSDFVIYIFGEKINLSDLEKVLNDMIVTACKNDLDKNIVDYLISFAMKAELLSGKIKKKRVHRDSLNFFFQNRLFFLRKRLLAYNICNAAMTYINSNPLDSAFCIFDKNLLKVLDYLLRHGESIAELDKSPFKYLFDITDVEYAHWEHDTYWCKVSWVDTLWKEIVPLLIENGADVNCKFDNGYTVLHLACMKGLSFKIVQCMVENGVNVIVEDKYGRRASFYAQSYDVCRFLQVKEWEAEKRIIAEKSKEIEPIEKNKEIKKKKRKEKPKKEVLKFGSTVTFVLGLSIYLFYKKQNNKNKNNYFKGISRKKSHPKNNKRYYSTYIANYTPTSQKKYDFKNYEKLPIIQNFGVSQKYIKKFVTKHNFIPNNYKAAPFGGTKIMNFAGKYFPMVRKIFKK